MRAGWFTSLFISLILLVGCTTKSSKCGDKALLLWPDAQGRYVFQEVGFRTLGTPYRLKGLAAEIFYESGLDESAFNSSPAEPKLTNSNGVCVPEDIASSLAVNAYAQFEHLYFFEQELGTAKQLTWPRKVGVEIHLIGDAVDVENNAHYYGTQDVITMVPYSLSDVPVSLNQGIVAHEHFHAHFQSQVVVRMNQALPSVIAGERYAPALQQKPSVEDLSTSDLQSASGLNNFILRAWNEGLADFFASVYTGQPDFFGVSVKVPGRELRGELALMMSGAVLQDQAQLPGPSVGEERVKALTSTSYSQGTILARLLYRLANSGVETPKTFLKRVMLRLDQIPLAILPGYRRQVMDFEKILPILLRDFPLSVESCAALRQVTSKGLMQSEFAACPN